MAKNGTHFSESHFEKKLSNLKDTQESIQGLSAWCLSHKTDLNHIIKCWLKAIKKGKPEQCLTLFYLANDGKLHTHIYIHSSYNIYMLMFYSYTTQQEKELVRPCFCLGICTKRSYSICKVFSIISWTLTRIFCAVDILHIICLFLSITKEMFNFGLYREEKVCNRVQRIFNIWEERDVYSSSFVQELIVLLESPKNIEAKPSLKLFSDFEVKYF